MEVVADTPLWHLKQRAAQFRPLFGKCTGRRHVHHLLHEVLDIICLRGDLAHGVALPVQGSKAVYQTDRDSGAWTSAALLGPIVDLVSPPRLAGTAQELEAATSYKKGDRGGSFGSGSTNGSHTSSATGNGPPQCTFFTTA